MKLAILVALAAVVTANPGLNPSIHSAVYKPGEQYVYHYKGQILSGVPKSSQQVSGMYIDALVLLQFQQDYKVVMKMENIKLSTIESQKVDQPEEPLDESRLTRITGEQEQIISEKLHLPIKFSYDEGEVRHILKELRDPYWSVNIKKGILSILQVTLKEKHSMTTEPNIYYDPTMSRIKSYRTRTYGSSSSSQFWNVAPKINSVYRVKETGVTGNCETKYTIISDKSSIGSGSVMHVSAVKNFDNCVSKPFSVEGLFQGVYSAPEEQELIQPTVHTDYVITGDRSHFLIQQASRHSKYIVHVNGLEGGDLTSFTHQTLKLKQVTPIRTPIHLTAPKMDARGLLMVIPKASLLPEKEDQEKVGSNFNSYLNKKRMEQDFKLSKSYDDEEETDDDDDDNENVELSTGNIVQTVEELLENLVQCMEMITADGECSKYLMDISKLLKESNRNQLRTIYNRYTKRDASTESPEYKKKEVLLDILPSLPNPEAAKVLIELIREGQISAFRGSVLVNAMSIIVKPSPSVIKHLLELFKELPKETTATKLSGKALLRQATLLSVGTLSRRLLVLMKQQGKPVPQVITFIDSVSMELKRMLEETSGEWEKILVLKSMGNMGASENIQIIKSLVEDRRESLKVRIFSVFALRRLAKEFKKQVIPILMGVFMDVNEERELRQAAFVVILKAKPSFTTLQMITHRLRHEPSTQVRTLVYSNLINLAYHTSHQPEHKQLVKDSRLVVKTMQPILVAPYDSLTVLLNKFSEEYDLGASLELTKIKSKNSGLPEALVANLQGTLFGKHRHLLEVGAEGKSLEVLLKKLIGPHGLLSSLIQGRINLEDILKPLVKQDLGGIENKIIEIMGKMRMQLPVEGEPFVKTYLHMLGNELQYLVVNKHNALDIVSKVIRLIEEWTLKLRSGIEIDVLKAGSLHSAITVPTPLGVPLSFNHTLAALFKAELSVKVDNLPTWPDLEPFKRLTLTQGWDHFRRLPINIPENLKLDLLVKPVIDVTQNVVFGADMRWIASGVGVEGFVKVAQPLRVSANLNKPEHSISLKYFPLKQESTALKARIAPTVFVTYVPTKIDMHSITCLMPSRLSRSNLEEFSTEYQNSEFQRNSRLESRSECLNPTVLVSHDIVKSKRFQYKIDSSMTGQEYKIEGSYTLCGPNWCPIMPLFGRQEIRLTTRPIATVEFVEMKIQSLRSNFEFEGIPAQQSTEELYRELEEQYERYESESVNYRTASREALLSGSQFEPITVDEIFQNDSPIKRQLRIIVRPSNGQSPALKTQLTWLMGRQRYVNQFNVQVLRAAHLGIPKIKVMLDSIVNPLQWYPEETYIGHRGEYLVKSILAVKIEDDLKVFKLKVVPGSPFDFQEELSQQSLLPVGELPEGKTNKYKYTLEVEFPEVRSYKIMKVLSVVRDLIKYHLYDKLSSVIPHQPLRNKLIVSVELLPWWEKMHIIVKSPREDLYITDVPFYWNPFLPSNQKVKLHNTYSWNQFKQLTQDQPENLFETLPYYETPILPTGQCSYSVETGKLVTFDNVHLPLDALPLYRQKSCSFVLAQHCTRDGLFSVILKGDAVTPKIMVLLPKYEIEWILQSTGQVVLLVNGERKHIVESQAVVLKDRFTESGMELYKIMKIGSSLYSLEAYELGLQVVLNSENKNIKIKLSQASMLQGQICGACGNSDFDPRNDMYPSRDFTPESRDLSEFIKATLIPSESCNLESIRPSSEEFCKKTAHVTVRRYDSESPMTCTTERKVIQCAKGCKPAETRSVKTCFRCEGESGRKQTLIKSRTTYYQPTTPSVWELEDSSVNCEQFSERLELPTTCIPAY